MFNIKLKGGIQPINTEGNKGLMTTQIKVRDILNIYRIDPEINRDLSYNRLPKIINYLDSFDSDLGIYFPSIVCSFPGSPLEFYDMEKMELEISEGVRLVVIDGQHRLKSLEQYMTKSHFNEDKKEEILNSDLTLQLYFGLTKTDEKSLFADMNSNSKRVSMSLITNYDTRDITNILIKELYQISKPLQSVKIEFNKSRLVRPTNTDFSTSVRLKKFVSILLFGKKSTNMKEEKLIKEYYDDILSFLERFFLVFIEVLPSEPGNVLKYVIGHEPLQSAIAYHLHKRIITECTNKVKWIINWEEEVIQLEKIDWSTKNPIWQPHMLTSRANTPFEFDLFIDSEENKLVSILDYNL
ncbi:DNA sulfur modification protein DndB [Bacillus sp. FSL W7-1034]|uniref:DNA sulfur modification protein DndB n=1 Tax=Bacillus sp. FSL W7-1034 TaxID=2954564 RepID=UPI00315A96D8